jgi:hypothetical protein
MKSGGITTHLDAEEELQVTEVLDGKGLTKLIDHTSEQLS